MTPSKPSTPPASQSRPPVLRTISSPPLSPASPLGSLKLDHLQQPSSLKIVTRLTPPTSPELARPSINSDTSKGAEHPSKSLSCFLQKQGKPILCGDSLQEGNVPHIIECPFEVEVVRDSANRPRVFGQGAWSKVYQAIVRRPNTVSSASSPRSILTPPPSPQTSVPLLVAVKTPLSNASRMVLRNEAITLSHLTSTPLHENFIVAFHGYVSATSSLVLAPVPLSLSDHISSRVRLARENHPQRDYTDPVLGHGGWLSLAGKTTIALAWLHDVGGVVHGDIKPGNILLLPSRSSDDFAFDPLLIDFSSSRILSSTSPISNTLSALTREYTAPELLSPSVLRDPLAVAKTASDVFSLAVTLIVAATGELTVYGGSVLRRQYMATQGWRVLEFVKNGDGGMRVPSGGVVERVVEDAVRKVDDARIHASRWRDLVRAIQKEEVPRQEMQDG
ncbi:hypothetical protein GJ744_000266 [Endocarpon pusillum]|uniref:Protein kinase domain-containing protein n=1 Tax=Endocarpon pusillum TaxID=364733 RepID=A0A8H7AQX6_9EURO|nr:hypothetical protein GJ744_000266 [Endocarpon pusillum]